MLKYILILLAIFTLAQCGSPSIPITNESENLSNSFKENLAINLDHFNHLYTEKQLLGKTIGLVHIYSEYPDYEYNIEPKEGFACVDDVSRAIILLSQMEGPSKRVRNMTEFILQMQNENGYFNNFIWADLSINKTYKTSDAKPDWWSWRALWALEAVYPIFLKDDPAFSDRIDQASKKLVGNILKLEGPPDSTKNIEGIIVPTTLPYGSASDQTSIMILGLVDYWERTRDVDVNNKIRELANGVMQMQLLNKDSFLYGMFLSWENLWHAYGNIQSFALLKAGGSMNEPAYITAALIEIDNFYPWLIKHGLAEYMLIKNEGNKYSILEEHSYPQIAYGIRPVVWACCEAYKVTKEKKYKKLAYEYLTWLSGNNDAQLPMYDPSTGRCFDGIISPKEINKNSGAESTIEALLSIQAYQKIATE